MAALTSPISDCDETFNYWEPMHYLVHGFGFQTWEYAPQFALRSYAYLYPYALFAKMGFWTCAQLGFDIGMCKIASFFFVRGVQAVFCALAETALYAAVGRCFGHRIGNLFLFLLVCSAGLFRSSVEFLPSSFSMICVMFAYAFWMDGGTAAAIGLIALASLLGWVFAAVLGLPLAVHTLARKEFSTFFVSSGLSAAFILAFMCAIDSYHYGRFLVAPLNHILYNVFPKEGTGSHIYGVESWTFYVINLVLNCNLSAVVAMAYPGMMVAFCYFRKWCQWHGIELRTRFQYLSGTYLALVIFLSQAHKEERFLAACYPFIALIGAVGVSDAVVVMQSVLRSDWVASSFVGVLLAGSFVGGVSRIAMQIDSFGAPLLVYQRLSRELRLTGGGDINICVGKEWYRFGSSFFLPDRKHRLRFIDTSFDGLLPRLYAEGDNGTRIVRQGFNEFNRAEHGQVFQFGDGGCDLFIDLDLEGRLKELDEGVRILGGDSWMVMVSRPFLVSELSAAGWRAFWLPFSLGRRWLKYGSYVLLVRRNGAL